MLAGVSDLDGTIHAKLRIAYIDAEALYDKTFPMQDASRERVFEQDDLYQHQALDHINQVLGYIRLIYLPMNHGMTLKPLQKPQNDTPEEQLRYKDDLAQQLPYLSYEDFSRDFDAKLADFATLIDTISGYQSKPFRKLGKVLMGLVLFTAAVIIAAYLSPVVGAAQC